LISEDPLSQDQLDDIKARRTRIYVFGRFPVMSPVFRKPYEPAFFCFYYDHLFSETMLAVCE